MATLVLFPPRGSSFGGDGTVAERWMAGRSLPARNRHRKLIAPSPMNVVIPATNTTEQSGLTATPAAVPPSP